MAEQWVLNLTKQLERPPPPPDSEQHTKCIYRVPKILTDVNAQAYEPKLVSFGPYHHDRRHLRLMEPHKHRALIQFLRRIAKASKTPEDVLVAMKKVEPSLLRAYDALPADEDEDDGLNRAHQRRHEWIKEKDEFLKLMIVDGCFALEVMLAEKRSATGEKGEYESHDPVFGSERKNYVTPDLKRDMLLIENQLPLLALSTLASIEGSGIGDVNDLIKAFYNISPGSPEDAITEEEEEENMKSPADRSLHILDLYRKTMTADGEYLPSYEENVQSATELMDAGVSFRKSRSKSYSDISFRSGQLSLPPIEIDDTTESLLLNLMAFERLHATAGNEVTAYAFFMDGLINTSSDVALMRTEEIIMGWVGCDGNIASLFNRITREATLVVFRDDIKVDVNRTLNLYCKKRTHRWRASFVQTYLKNPWVFTSLVGGLFLIVLTVLQTIYTIMGYYKA